MLLKKINQINDVLSKLISITKNDIEYIKKAEHNKLFQNISKKERLAEQFSNLKNEIDAILAGRNKPIEEIFDKNEAKEFELFKHSLSEFNQLHKFFAKLSFSVTNFYNILLDKIKNKEHITYDKDSLPSSILTIKA